MPAPGPDRDFTSGLFLGLRHSHGSLIPWAALTTGRPPVLDAALTTTPARQAARLLGVAEAQLRRSSLHALFDVIVALVPPGGAVVIDEAAYPVSHWAAAAASGRGIRTICYRHHDADHAVAQCRRWTRPTMVLSDGWCGSCSSPAPVSDLAAGARSTGSRLVIDDSLAVGILGRRHRGGGWFGSGGAGLPAWLDMGPDDDGPLVVASLAKGYGVPLAVIGGPLGPMAEVRRASRTPLHAGGPTAADLAALATVVALPSSALAARRHHLGRLTYDLRCRLRNLGLAPVGLPFPYVLADAGVHAVALVRRLSGAGFGVLAVERRCGRRPGPAVLGVALRADHGADDVAALDRQLDAALGVVASRRVA